MERGWKPMVEISPNCPRCGSSNTKFCYYNNYSLTQPRYFCKGCRRYWTKGGSLRNVPVGGGCRKNRRPTKPLTLTPSPSNPKFHHNNDVSHRRHGGLPDLDGSPDIDLAVVYANFVNQKPDAPVNFPAVNTVSNVASNFSVLSESGVVGCGNFCEFSMQECGLGAGDYQVASCVELEEKNNNHQVDNTEEITAARELELPPLPGEDMVGGWSNSTLMVNHHRLQPTRVEMFGMETQDPNLLSGNWSPIDFSSYDTFSRA